MKQNEPNTEPKNKPQEGGLPSTALLCKEVKELCDKIINTPYEYLGKSEYREIEGLAFALIHYPSILNS